MEITTTSSVFIVGPTSAELFKNIPIPTQRHRVYLL
ncbi:MAG: hypothetical protein K0R14_1478 [Burkholderiales bacterium]|jgi:hypothetical protein|nr:hypothetical protein [Burkholderiales bacterium]